MLCEPLLSNCFCFFSGVEYVNGLPQIIEEYEKEDGEEDDEEGEEGIVSDVKHGDDVVLALDIDEADMCVVDVTESKNEDAELGVRMLS